MQIPLDSVCTVTLNCTGFSLVGNEAAHIASVAGSGCLVAARVDRALAPHRQRAGQQ